MLELLRNGAVHRGNHGRESVLPSGPNGSRETIMSFHVESEQHTSPDDGFSASLLRRGVVSTQTIDLNTLFPQEVTESGSFDLARAKQATFERLLEAISVPTLLVATSHVITFTNSAFNRLTSNRLKTGSINFYSLFPTPREARKAQFLIEKVFKDKKPEERETLLKIRNSHIWARIHLRSIRLGPDRLLLVQIENLTAQKQLLAFQKYKKLVNLFPIGIVELRIPGSIDYRVAIRPLVEGILNARVVDGNNEFAAIYGRRSIDELKGVEFAVLFASVETRQAVCEQWIKTGFQNHSFDSQETGLGKHTRHYENILIANVVNRHLHGFWWLKRDISEKKKAEEDMLRARKLESLGILAGGIAHDFNNLLTAILGNVCLSQRDLSPSEKAFERMSSAAEAVHKAQELTTQLLTFSRGGTPIRKKASIGELLRDSVIFALRGSNVRHLIAIPDDLRLVEVDETQMHRVIHNLAINAWQAMPNGGTFRVQAENLDLKNGHSLPLKVGPHIRISFRDSGQGIPRENLNKIFDPYFTTKEKGTGLGLATAYSIVRNHGGLMTVRSKVGVGSIFYCYLPAVSPSHDTPDADREALVQLRGRILVMDDDHLIRDLAQGILGSEGFEVLLARDGAEAIALYRREQDLGRKIDAVVMDLTIPGGMGGKEAIRELRRIDPEAKAIVSSGYSDDPIMAEYEKHGFVGVLQKPYTPSAMTALVEAILAKD
jgi:two-component system, cell cycle sensor histidine kinase and response regulator CckA